MLTAEAWTLTEIHTNALECSAEGADDMPVSSLDLEG